MNQLLSKAIRLQKQYKFIEPNYWTPEEKEALVNDFTFHSNKLEGLKLAYGDTLDFLKKGIIRKHAQIKDISNLKNHKSLLNKVFDNYDKMTLSVQLVKDLHAEMMKDKISGNELIHTPVVPENLNRKITTERERMVSIRSTWIGCQFPGHWKSCVKKPMID